MNTVEKIQWLVDNEGCELADGYGGLQSFFQYCTCGEDEDVLRVIAPLVDMQYDAVLSEHEDREDEETCLDQFAKFFDKIKVKYLRYEDDGYTYIEFGNGSFFEFAPDGSLASRCEY